MWIKIKNFFRSVRENAVIAFLIGLVVFCIIYFSKLKTLVLGFFYGATDSLREQKDKEDAKKNKEYRATKVNQENKTKKTKRKTSTKKVAVDLIEENKRELERIKNEK